MRYDGHHDLSTAEKDAKRFVRGLSVYAKQSVYAAYLRFRPNKFSLLNY